MRFAAIALWIAALCGPAAAGVTEITLIDGQQPHAALVLPPQPHEDEELAARELRDHLRRMSGVALPVVEGRAPDGLAPVRLGLELTPEAEQHIRARSDDRAAFLLEVTGEGVALAGLTPEGTLFAAYELLEQLGCRWYMPGELGTVVPHRPKVTAEVQRTVRFPSFAARNLQAVTRALPWYRRQRLGGDWFPGAHGIPLEPPADVETEPELFALVDGRRVSGQLCVSHPEVVRRATAAVIDYFSGGKTVTTQNAGYEEPVEIPACPAAAVETAVAAAVERGVLRLVNGPASFQAEPLPAGVLTAVATLRAPLAPLPVQRLMADALPDAWKTGEATVLALSVALAGQEGCPIPWAVLRRAIDDAVSSRWLEVVPDGGAWPCDAAGAAAVTLKPPADFDPVSVSETKGVYTSSAVLAPDALQDLTDALPDIVKAAAGVPLGFRLEVTLGSGKDKEVASETVESINELLKEVSPDLRLRP